MHRKVLIGKLVFESKVERSRVDGSDASWKKVHKDFFHYGMYASFLTRDAMRVTRDRLESTLFKLYRTVQETLRFGSRLFLNLHMTIWNISRTAIIVLLEFHTLLTFRELNPVRRPAFINNINQMTSSFFSILTNVGWFFFIVKCALFESKLILFI